MVRSKVVFSYLFFSLVQFSFRQYVFAINSYPLLHIPLPGTIPTKIILPYESQSNTLKTSIVSNLDSDSAQQIDVAEMPANASIDQPPFPWASNEPFAYIQQIVFRSSVIPWKKNFLLTDAYRSPLYEIFKLLEIVRNHEDEKR